MSFVLWVFASVQRKVGMKLWWNVFFHCEWEEEMGGRNEMRAQAEIEDKAVMVESSFSMGIFSLVISYYNCHNNFVYDVIKHL